MKNGTAVTVKATGAQGMIVDSYDSDEGTIYQIIVDADCQAFCTAEQITPRRYAAEYNGRQVLVTIPED